MDWTQELHVMPSMRILTTGARGWVKQGCGAVSLAWIAPAGHGVDKAGVGEMDIGLRGPVESQG